MTERQGGWQPIDTVPKDGTAVWLWCDGKSYIGYCEPANPPLYPTDCWYLKATVRKRDTLPDDILGVYAYDADPTLWMHLPPSPPKEDQT